ncbi:hypothetical protein [Blautia massiliensis (ex Durand et al. 2017)]|uniref:hypothetical protein n=1 Tax=Blautia massiliensis (ex Durand et al. 2017) TaxID=1737424 RepID=UPI00242E2681|nr:hypothetical protein [Blautia massiliensis (ex Durand et al. 2017)]MDD6550079.1 hypothetical protein [Blautia massiliensis (ex Durand et al. 2017)]
MDFTAEELANLPFLTTTAEKEFEKELETDRGWEELEEKTLEKLTDDWLSR